MDLAHVRKNAAINAGILTDIIGAQSAYRSKLILVEYTTFCPATTLVEYWKSNGPVTLSTVEAAEVLSLNGKSLQNKLYINDATVELLDHSNDAPLRLLKILNSLRQKDDCMVLIDIQVDIIQPKVVSWMEYIADTVIHVRNSNPLTLSIVHRVSGGKLKMETVVLEDNKFVSFQTEQSEAISSASGLQPVSTFNLSLTSAQVAAKSNVELPHLRAQLGNVGLSYSKPVLAEDHDDEDPDEDLDI